MIIQTTDNRFFKVRDTGSADLAHVWFGIEMKQSKGAFVPKKNARETMVRKAMSQIVQR